MGAVKTLVTEELRTPDYSTRARVRTLNTSSSRRTSSALTGCPSPRSR